MCVHTIHKQNTCNVKGLNIRKHPVGVTQKNQSHFQTPHLFLYTEFQNSSFSPFVLTVKCARAKMCNSHQVIIQDNIIHCMYYSPFMFIHLSTFPTIL